MVCPGCRRETNKIDYCQWCFNPLGGPQIGGAPGAEPTIGMAPGYAAVQQIQAPAAPQPLAAPQAPPPMPWQIPNAAPAMPAAPQAPPMPPYTSVGMQTPAAPNPMLAGPPPLAQDPSAAMPLPNYLTGSQQAPPVQAPTMQMGAPLAGGLAGYAAAPAPQGPAMQPPGMQPPGMQPPPQMPGYAAVTATQPAQGRMPSMYGGAARRLAGEDAAALPAAAYSPHLMEKAEPEEEVPLMHRWDRALAISLPVLAISIAAMHFTAFAAQAFFWIALINFFVLGLAMGATRAIRSFDEELMDIAIAVVASYIFGPAVALLAVVVVSMVKSEWNTGLITVLVGHIVVRVIFVLAFESLLARYMPILPYVKVTVSIEYITSFLCVAASIGGGMLGNLFRPVGD